MVETKGHLTRYNVFVVIFASVGSLLTGYLQGTSSQTLGQATFYQSLNLVEDQHDPGYSKTNKIISAANGIFYAGGFFGSLLTGYLARRIGHLQNFKVSAIVALVGTAIQGGSVDQPMYLVSRFITGMGSAQVLAAMPPYYSEVAPPTSRGLLTGMQGIMVNVGYVVVLFIGFGCFFAPDTNTFGWRFPVAFGCFFCLLLLGASFLIPESPRYLVSRNRIDEALKVMIRLHGGSSDDDEFARREVALIESQLLTDEELIISGGRWQILTQMTYLKRVAISLILILGTQNLGVIVIFNYQILLFKSLNLSPTVSQLLPAIYELVAVIANVIGAILSDRIRRRRALLIGFVLNVSMFIIFTGLVAKFTQTESKTYASAAVAFIFLYVAVFGTFIDVNQYTFVSEIFPSHLRPMGMGIAISAYFLINLLWTQVAPTATANIGWKFYLIFICLGILHLCLLAVFLPDTTGIPLEEIDRLFGKEVAQNIETVTVETKRDVEEKK